MKFEEILPKLRAGCAVRLPSWANKAMMFDAKDANEWIWIFPDWNNGWLKSGICSSFARCDLMSELWEVVWDPKQKEEKIEPVEEKSVDEELKLEFLNVCHEHLASITPVLSSRILWIANEAICKRRWVVYTDDIVKEVGIGKELVMRLTFAAIGFLTGKGPVEREPNT